MTAPPIADKLSFLGITLSRIQVPDYVDLVRTAIARGCCWTFTYAHFHTVNLACEDPVVREVLNKIDVVTPDGIALVVSTRCFGRPFTRQNILVNEYAMAQLAPAARQNGWTLYLFGGDHGIAARAAERLCRMYPGLLIAGTQHGQIETAEEMQSVVGAIAAAKPNVLLVGLGQPRQEEWMLMYRETLGVNVMVGVGGYLEKLARRDTVYPAWVNRTHLYWLFRLFTEPGRVWKRYSIGAPKFVWNLYRFRFRQSYGL